MQKLGGWWRWSERRAYRRQHSDGVRIDLAGKRCVVIDWSMGGFRVRAPDLPATRGDRIEGVIAYRGCRGEFGAEVLSASDSMLTARFVDITPRVLLAMSGLGER